jgi:hypothetical protein
VLLAFPFCFLSSAAPRIAASFPDCFFFSFCFSNSASLPCFGCFPFSAPSFFFLCPKRSATGLEVKAAFFSFADKIGFFLCTVTWASFFNFSSGSFSFFTLISKAVPLSGV